MKKLLAGAVAGLITNMLLGFLVYEVLLGDYYASQMNEAALALEREEMQWLWLILGSFLMAAFIAYIFVQWAGIKTFAGGAKAGIILGLLIGFGYNFIWYATMDMMSLNGAVVDSIVTGVWWGITGGVVGFVLGLIGGKD